MVSNSFPLWTDKAIRTNKPPTEMEIKRLIIFVLRFGFSFSHSGKKYKQSKNKAVVAVSTTIWVSAISGARKTTNNMAMEKPSTPFNKIAVNRDFATSIIKLAVIITRKMMTTNVVTGASFVISNEKAFV